MGGSPQTLPHLGGERADRAQPVAKTDDRGWSLYGAPWLQPVANSGKSTERITAATKPNLLRRVATGCLRRSMVSRASAVGCHPLREVPSLRRRGSIHLLGGAISCCCSPGTGTGRNRSRCMPCGSCLDFTRSEINPGARRVTVGSLKEEGATSSGSKVRSSLPRRTAVGQILHGRRGRRFEPVSWLC
jgi:hypothetical protein